MATMTHASVVYVHGMGSQKRYQEVSRLVDALDQWADENRTEDGGGRLRGIRPRLEPCRPSGEGEVAYVDVTRLPGTTGAQGRKHVRFYEAYWAPIAAGGTSPRQVLLWIVRQCANPLRALASPWRTRSRLRRALLHHLHASEVDAGGTWTEADFGRLLAAYDAFEEPDARRDHPDGTFADFEDFLDERREAAGSGEDLVPRARAWHRAFVRNELGTLAVLATVLLVLALGVAALVAGAWFLWRYLSGTSLAASLSSAGIDFPVASWESLCAVVGFALSAVGLRGFLRDYAGDVMLWCTYEETDERHRRRRAILDRAVETLRHVLADPDCDRVVVVSHSLGTAIAADALLALGQHDRAREGDPSTCLPLHRLDQLVTLASPVDKIHYFFESYQSREHRYTRVVEDLRGDLGTLPFTVRERAHVHWVNVWDRADVVSGPLTTPTNRTRHDLTVDNVEVGIGSALNPGAAHSAYFTSSLVRGWLYEIIFEGRWSFHPAPPAPAPSPPAAPFPRLGPGAGRRFTALWHSLALAVPWVAVAVLVTRLLGLERSVVEALTHVAFASVALVVLGWLVRRPRRATPPARSRRREPVRA